MRLVARVLQNPLCSCSRTILAMHSTGDTFCLTCSGGTERNLRLSRCYLSPDLHLAVSCWVEVLKVNFSYWGFDQSLNFAPKITLCFQEPLLLLAQGCSLTHHCSSDKYLAAGISVKGWGGWRDFRLLPFGACSKRKKTILGPQKYLGPSTDLMVKRDTSLKPSFAQQADTP